MPLFWNDEKFRWIGDDESYDESEYFVVRKLYVELKQTSRFITLNDITRIFKKYGPLENVELRHSDVRDWAYITFCNDKDAYSAMRKQRLQKNYNISNISPAHTWKQPSAVQQSANDASPNSDEASLLMLNDDCLLKIFEYCDLHSQAILWKVCQRTRNLLEVFVLPKVNEYEINFAKGKPKKRLKRVREELQCIGPYVKKLCVVEDRFRTDSETIDPYMVQCSKYSGASLKELDLRNIPSRNLESIRPLLLEIESLIVRTSFWTSSWYDEDYKIPVDMQFPKLKELQLYAHNPHPDEETIGIREKNILQNRFPRLEKADIRLFYIDNVIEIFLKNNAHLKYLLIREQANEHIINAISKESKNLEQLVLFGPFDDEADLLSLNANEKLTKLVLLKSENDDQYFPKIEKVQQLRSIMMLSNVEGKSGNDSSAYVVFVRRMPNLEHFCSDFVWNQSTIIEFVKQARHLKTFCIVKDESVDLITVNLIETVAEVRKSIFENGSNGIVPLELIICRRDEQLPNPSIELSAEMAKYVTVSFLWSSAKKHFDPASLARDWCY